MIRFVLRLLIVVLLFGAALALGWHWRSRAAEAPDDASLTARLSQISESVSSLELLESGRAESAREVLERGLREGLEEADRLSQRLGEGWSEGAAELEESVRRAGEYVRRQDLGEDLRRKADRVLERLRGGRDRSPYAGATEAREIAALGPEEIEGLRQGEGMGLALAAELHRYPGPKHVLELADALDLSGEQRDDTREIFDRMRREARRLGREVVERERELDRLFAEQRIDDAALERLTAEIARLGGRLRAVHLEAHLRQREVLTDEQVARYEELRGYGESGATHDPRRHHGGGV